LDQTKPDGTPRKLMESSKINLAGWKVKIDLKKGIESLYRNQF
jgi:GDP-L-fucose synthase